MLLVHQLVQDHLPTKRRQTAKGWITFNGVCCHHRGHNPDTRSRGNLLISADGSMVINCYNCGFKTMHKGGDISGNFEIWLGYLGIPRAKIQAAKLELLSLKLSGEIESIETGDFLRPENFPEASLPKHARPINEWLESDEVAPELATCMEYLISRGRAVAENHSYYWTPITRWDLNHRILIPFYHRDRIIGWTGRYAGLPPKEVPRYYNSDLPSGYLFNNSVLDHKNRRYVLITEGPFDAIAVDGIAVLGSKINQQQIAWLNSSPKEKIVVPDRQMKNQELIDTALEQGWSVSFPDWAQGIKDAADSSKRYGRLYTIASVIQARTKSTLEISMKRQMMRS